VDGPAACGDGPATVSREAGAIPCRPTSAWRTATASRSRDRIPPDAAGPLFGLAAPGGHRRILLDLGEVAFLSSHALAILIGLHRRVKAAGGRLAHCGLADAPGSVLRNTQLDRILGVYGSRQEAIAALQG